MVEAGPGDVITCNPGEVHDGRPIGDTRTWRMLYLPPELVSAIREDICEGAGTQFEFSHPVISEQTQTRMFESVYEAVADRCIDAECAQERLIVLLAGLLQSRPRASRLPSEACKRAKARIDEDPAAPMTLAELAHEAGVSRFQLLRGFVSCTGLTPHAYIVQRRMDAARSMVARGESLATAATTCGFADQSHFNRLFVRRYGMTPGAYARALR
jgi:AraC-like DNA-binding protein